MKFLAIIFVLAPLIRVSCSHVPLELTLSLSLFFIYVLSITSMLPSCVSISFTANCIIMIIISGYT